MTALATPANCARSTTKPSSHPVPDQQGANLYASDPDLHALLTLYLPAPLLAHLEPHLQHLGGLAGGVLDSLAQTADQNPPVLVHRTRSGIDAQRLSDSGDGAHLFGSPVHPTSSSR